jgi:sigma-E factor negative regulatory protein RseB
LTFLSRTLPAVLALAGVFFCAPLAAEARKQDVAADAKEWLRAMRASSGRWNFQGIAAYWRYDHLRTLRIRHEVVNGKEREQIEALDDTDGDVAAPSGPMNAETQNILAWGVNQTPSPTGSGPLDLSLAERYYHFDMGQAGRIAGRNALEIIIAPLDTARYGRRIWIDRDSRLPLKHELIAPDGRILEQFVFAQIEVGEPAAASVTPPSVGHAPSRQPLDSLAWRLDNVPKGYRIVAYTRHNAPKGPVIEHLLLSDGFSSISVYIEETPDALPDEGRVRRFGAMHVFSRQAGRHRVTVMAEAPASTVIQIAQGVRRGEP